MNKISNNLPSKEIIKTAQEHIDLALKVLATESFVASRYLSIAQRRWRNVPTMRLNAKILPLSLDINPYFAATIEPNLLLSCFYIESIRIALHHCTRSAMPENAYTLSSIFICSNQAKAAIPYNKISDKKYILSEIDFQNITKGDFFLSERVEDWEKNKSYDILNQVISTIHLPVLQTIFEKIKLLDKKDFLTFNSSDEAFIFYTYPGKISEENEKANTSNSDDSQENSGPSSVSIPSNGENPSNESDESSDSDSTTIHLDGNDMDSDNPSNGTSKEWKEEDLINKTIEHTTSEMQQLSSNDWGTLDNAKLKNDIMAVNAPKIDEREILKRFNQSVKSTQVDKTRMRPNRRKNADFGTIGYRRTYKSKVLVAVDTSGSMNDDLISLGITIAVKCLPDAEVNLCYWDTYATEPMDIKFMNKRKEYLGVCGGGGTIPSCIFDMLKKINNKVHYDGVIVFSDMFFDYPPKEKKKTIWLCCTDKELIKETCFPSWGTRLELADLIKSENDFNEDRHSAKAEDFPV